MSINQGRSAAGLRSPFHYRHEPQIDRIGVDVVTGSRRRAASTVMLRRLRQQYSSLTHLLPANFIITAYGQRP